MGFRNGIIIIISLIILGSHSSLLANNQAYCDNVWPGTSWDGRTCTQGADPSSKYLGDQTSSQYRPPATIITSRTLIRTDGHAYCNNVWPRTSWNGVSCDRSRKLELTISNSFSSGGGYIIGGGGSYSSGSITIGGGSN
jgi:hypothetical protein